MILSLLLPGLARVSLNILGIGSEFYKLSLRVSFFFLIIYIFEVCSQSLFSKRTPNSDDNTTQFIHRRQ